MYELTHEFDNDGPNLLSVGIIVFLHASELQISGTVFSRN